MSLLEAAGIGVDYALGYGAGFDAGIDDDEIDGAGRPRVNKTQ